MLNLRFGKKKLPSISEKIKKATGLNDGSGSSTRALERLPFGYPNSFTNLQIDNYRKQSLDQQLKSEPERDDIIKEYILKMVGVAARETEVENLLIRSGHLDPIIFDALAEALERIENIQPERFLFLRIQIALINASCTSSAELQNFIYRNEQLTDIDRNNLFKKKISWRFIEFLRKHKSQIGYFCIHNFSRLNKDELDKKLRFIGFFDNQDKVRIVRAWQGYSRKESDSDEKTFHHAEVYFNSLIDKQFCQDLLCLNLPSEDIHELVDENLCEPA